MKLNSCACVLTVMYKQDILCKFLLNINVISKKSKQMHQHRIRLHDPYVCLKNIFTRVQTLSQEEKKKDKTKIQKQLHIPVSCVVFILCLSILRTVGNSITLPAS